MQVHYFRDGQSEDISTHWDYPRPNPTREMQYSANLTIDRCKVRKKLNKWPLVPPRSLCC